MDDVESNQELPDKRGFHANEEGIGGDVLAAEEAVDGIDLHVCRKEVDHLQFLVELLEDLLLVVDLNDVADLPQSVRVEQVHLLQLHEDLVHLSLVLNPVSRVSSTWGR